MRTILPTTTNVKETIIHDLHNLPLLLVNHLPHSVHSHPPTKEITMFTIRITKEVKTTERTRPTGPLELPTKLNHKTIEKEVMLLRVLTLDIKKVYKAILNLT